MKFSGGKQGIFSPLTITLLMAVILTVVATVWVTIATQNKVPHLESTSETPPARPISFTANTLFMGDIYWGRYMNDWAMASPLKTAYPFSRLNEFNREKYDAWIADLECPTVPGFTQTSLEEDTTLSFNCSPDYLPEAAKWFTAVSLANNHTDNRGADGFVQTQQQLEANRMQYFGHYDPTVTEDACEVITLPVKVTYDDTSIKDQKLPIALCGFHGVFKIPPASTIAQIKKYAEYMPVIAMPHMGAEYQTAPDELRIQTYRSMIDAGADVVLGNHPHWIQTTEAYKGKLIVYSMGNFMFDQQANQEVTRSAAINVVMKSTASSNRDLIPWLSFGGDCAIYKDQCLQRAIDQNLKKLPVEYRFGVVGSNDSGKITKPATPEQTALILQRLKWTQTMSQLQPPQGSL